MTTPTSSDDQVQLRAGGWAPLGRDVVRLEGPESTSFLQGQCSQDVEALAPGDAAWSFLLQPQGKVDAWIRVTRWDQDLFLLDVDAGFAGAVIERLARFKLRTKVEIERDDGWRFLAVRGPVEVQVSHDPGAHVLPLPVYWRGMVGYDLLAPASTNLHVGVPEVDPGALEAVRVECGVPALGAELTDRTIPAEIGEWIIEASVSFSKGCYTGQELVARIDSRGGNVPRRLRGFVCAGDTIPVRGAAVVADGETVGEVTSVARSAARGAPVGLAMVKRAVQPPVPVSMRGDEGEVTAQLEELPLVGTEPA